MFYSPLAPPLKLWRHTVVEYPIAMGIGKAATNYFTTTDQAIALYVPLVK
jgi:hypothetical protein